MPHSTSAPTLAAVNGSHHQSEVASSNGNGGMTEDSQLRYKMPPRVPTTAMGDYDTSYTLDQRRKHKTYGLVPPAVETFEVQAQRCLKLLEMKNTQLEKYQYLTHLKATNVHLFYRLMRDNVKTLCPIIYTPTVGEACVRWSELFTQPEGLYISYEDRGNISSVLESWPQDVDITVITDGSRILGLGDLGVNGMGIPVGKLALYTACAGIRPERTLPITLDLGTSNERLRNDPLYLGSRRGKVTHEEEIAFLDELMEALTRRWPDIVIQFEDFKNPFPALERYRDKYTCFNDDIQGTGAVILAGFMTAVKATGIPVRDHRAVFLGAGSAGVGVARQLVEFFVKEGLTEDEARRCFWLVDSNGLVTDDRGDKLAAHKTYFSRDDNAGKQIQSLARLIAFVEPTILMGLSTIGGAFNRDVLQRMAKLNRNPIVFPLSNPSSKSECTFQDAVVHTEGRVLFASGSPFPEMEYGGKMLTPGQGNNMYVFPGIGLAAILCRAVSITQSMIYASASSLSLALNADEKAAGWLYPDLARIRDVSVKVAAGVIRAAQAADVDRVKTLRDLSEDQLEAWIREQMYDPFDPERGAGWEVVRPQQKEEELDVVASEVRVEVVDVKAPPHHHLRGYDAGTDGDETGRRGRNPSREPRDGNGVLAGKKGESVVVVEEMLIDKREESPALWVKPDPNAAAVPKPTIVGPTVAKFQFLGQGIGTKKSSGFQLHASMLGGSKAGSAVGVGGAAAGVGVTK